MRPSEHDARVGSPAAGEPAFGCMWSRIMGVVQSCKESAVNTHTPDANSPPCDCSTAGSAITPFSPDAHQRMDEPIAGVSSRPRLASALHSDSWKGCGVMRSQGDLGQRLVVGEQKRRIPMREAPSDKLLVGTGDHAGLLNRCDLPSQLGIDCGRTSALLNSIMDRTYAPRPALAVGGDSR